MRSTSNYAKIRRDRFNRIATYRTKNVIKAIRILGKCSDIHNYLYTDEQKKLIFKELRKELRICEKRFDIEKDIEKFEF